MKFEAEIPVRTGETGDHTYGCSIVKRGVKNPKKKFCPIFFSVNGGLLVELENEI